MTWITAFDNRFRLANLVGQNACDWMKQFDKALAKTAGIGSADRADLVSGSQAIESTLGSRK